MIFFGHLCQKHTLNLWAKNPEPKKQIAKKFFSSRSYKTLVRNLKFELNLKLPHFDYIFGHPGHVFGQISKRDDLETPYSS